MSIANALREISEFLHTEPQEMTSNDEYNERREDVLNNHFFLIYDHLMAKDDPAQREAVRGAEMVAPEMEETGDATKAPATDLRDQFAMAALQGVLSDSEALYQTFGDLAGDCYAIADVMLKEREK